MEVWVKVCLPIVASAVLGCVLLGFAQPENRGIFIVILAVASTILAWLNYRQVSSLRELSARQCLGLNCVVLTICQ